MATKFRAPLIHLCNFLDALCTLCFVGLLRVEEANPLLAWCFQYSETNFLVVKFVCCTFAVSYLDSHMRKQHRWVLDAILCMFLMVLCWHAYGLISLLTLSSPTLGIR